MGDEVKRDVKTDTAAPTPGQDLRAARVARTEAQLIAAATELFLERGYVATTLVQIALHAGIAPRTVYLRFGTKAALFRRVVDRALVGDAEPIAVLDRPGTQMAMTAKTLPQRIEALVEVAAGIVERAGALFEVAAQAEGVEPEVAEAAQAGRRATAELCATFWSCHRRRAARPRDRCRGAGSRHRCPHLCGHRCAPQAHTRMDRARAPSSDHTNPRRTSPPARISYAPGPDSPPYARPRLLPTTVVPRVSKS